MFFLLEQIGKYPGQGHWTLVASAAWDLFPVLEERSSFVLG